jgi:hypothetical protein
MVWTLVRLAWRSSSFHDSALALGLLAEAENETWANNASAEFVARFQIFLSGTAVPYVDRLPVIDELLREQRPSLTRLVIKALGQVGSRDAFRHGGGPVSDELPEREWQPRTGTEHLECIESAITRLNEIAKSRMADIAADLFAAAQSLSTTLLDKALRGLVVGFFDAVREAYPEERESMRRAIAQIILRERKYRKKLSAEELEELEKLHAHFEDPSLAARLRQHVGEESWDREEEHDLKPLATELLSTSNVIEECWPWLTSGEASDAWRLGEALASVDTTGSLSEGLPQLSSGRDLRLLCGYISARRRALGDEWYTRWVTSQFEQTPRPIHLLFQVASRCGVTGSIASLLVTLLRSEPVDPQVVGQLEYGRWDEDLSLDVLEKLFRAMVDTGHLETAIGFLHRRMKFDPAEIERWKSIALELVTVSRLIRSTNTMVSFYWVEVTNLIVVDYPREIIKAIFREQADRESGTWFAEHSQAKEIIESCVETDPGMVWQELKSYLSAPEKALMFSIGFPRGVIDRMPADEVGAWIAEKPEVRGAAVARLATKNFLTDETLPSRILGTYGDTEDVAGAFFSSYVSGTWWGSSSAHWNQLADSLEEVAGRTKLPKLHRWATDAVRSLRSMAERDQQREEEDDLPSR